MRLPRVRFKVRHQLEAILGLALLLGWACWFDAARVAERKARADSFTADEWRQYGSGREAAEAAGVVRDKARPWAEGGPSVTSVLMGTTLIVGALSLAHSIGKAIRVHRRRKIASTRL